MFNNCECISKNKKPKNINKNTIKISIWGIEKIGKTLLANKIVGRETINEYYPTIGIDFFCKILSDKKIYFWDLGGNPRIEEICLKYIEISDITLILYKENDIESIEKANYLIKRYLLEKNFLLLEITNEKNFVFNGKMINIIDNIGIQELLHYIIHIFK